MRYRVQGALRDVVNCHCERCRRITGHFMAATSASSSDLVLEGSATLRWWQATARVRYGFCGTCGSTLFWRCEGRNHTSIAAGTLDPPTGLTTAAAWYVRDAADYHRRDPELRELTTE